LIDALCTRPIPDEMMEVADQSTPCQSFSWKELWQGSCEAIIPFGDYHWALPSPAESYQGRKKTLASWWTDHQVPAFLRHHVPVLVSDGNVQYEFLTGRSSPLLHQSKEYLLVSFHFE
jgi:tRNA(Ile)-lysidine synthase